MKRVLLLCLILVPILSCKKKDSEKMSISGQVFDINQNISVSGVAIDLYVKKVESGVYSAGYTLIQSINSDASGNFSFSFDAVVADNFKLSFKKIGYFESEQEINPENVTKGNNYYQQYQIHAEAFLNLHVQNISPAYNTDQITFRLKKGALNAYECCWDSFYTYIGKNVNVYQLCKIYGAQTVVFEWNVTNSFSTVFHTDSIYCSSFDTTAFDIFY